MSVTTTTHVNFRGRAREALAFYASVLGGSRSVDEVAFARVDGPEWLLDHGL